MSFSEKAQSDKDCHSEVTDSDHAGDMSTDHTLYSIDFNVVMKEIGSFGKYQIVLVLLAYWIPIPCGINQVASVFLSPIPDHRCIR